MDIGHTEHFAGANGRVSLMKSEGKQTTFHISIMTFPEVPLYTTIFLTELQAEELERALNRCRAANQADAQAVAA
jgi:hypothetical protein